MGKATKLKNDKIAAAKQVVADRLAEHSIKQNAIVVKELDPQLLFKPYIDFAVRDPAGFQFKTKSQSNDKKLLLAAKYYFEKYRVPKILENVWEFAHTHRDRFGRDIATGATAPEKIKTSKFCDWYICLGRGDSLYKEYIKPEGIFTKREMNLFLNVDPNLRLTIEQGMVYAVAHAVSNNTGIAGRIARSRICERPFNEFWKGVIRYFADHLPDNIAEINDLCDYLNHKRNEDRNFVLYGSGISLQALRKRNKDWHYTLARAKRMGSETWEGHAIDDQILTDSTKNPDTKTHWKWSFKQIKTSKDLAAEGSAQRHCVYSYQSDCIAGRISIWSLSVEQYEGEGFKRALTIELSNNGTVKQMRGVGNRIPKPAERRIVEMWAAKNVLNISSSNGW